MIFLGILSFLQITFLPGYIILRLVRLGIKSKIHIFIYSFALSLLSNYALVYILTLMGIYKSYTLYALFIIETAILIYLLIRSRSCIKIDLSSVNITGFFKKNPAINNISYSLALIIIAFFIFNFFRNIGTVFKVWDAVFSWNRWAIEWSSNTLPISTRLYPQLIPTNLSMTYVFIQNDHVQVFSKSIMPLFALSIILLFFKLAYRKEQLACLAGLVIFSIMSLLSFIYPIDFLSGGTADTAAAFFSFLVLSIYISGTMDNKKLILINLFACAASVTKAYGLYILLLVIIYDIYFLYRNRRSYSKRQLLGIISVIILIVLLIGLSWYAYKLIEIDRGLESSNIKDAAVTGHNGRNILQRIQNGMHFLLLQPNKILEIAAYLFYIFVFILILLSLFTREARYVTIFIVVPFFLSWIILYSYNERNLIVSAPFIAYSSAHGFSFLIKRLSGYFKGIKKYISLKISYARGPVFNIKKTAFIIFITLLALAASISSLFIDSDPIIDRQIRLQKGIGNSQLNEFLYYYQETCGFGGEILTDYKTIAILPGFRENGISTQYIQHNPLIKVMKQGDSFLDSASGNTEYLLLKKNGITVEEEEIIDERIEQNYYKILYNKDNFILLEIVGK